MENPIEMDDLQVPPFQEPESSCGMEGDYKTDRITKVASSASAFNEILLLGLSESQSRNILCSHFLASGDVYPLFSQTQKILSDLPAFIGQNHSFQPKFHWTKTQLPWFDKNLQLWQHYYYHYYHREKPYIESYIVNHSHYHYFRMEKTHYLLLLP